KPKGKCSNIANRASSTFSSTTVAKPPAPLISIFKAVPPNTLNHRTAIIPGTSKTPVINWRTVRPLEIRAINKPIKGAQAMCQAQKKIVFLPSQSLSVKGVKVKDMGTILEIYPPNVVTKLSAINKEIGRAHV